MRSASSTSAGRVESDLGCSPNGQAKILPMRKGLLLLSARSERCPKADGSAAADVEVLRVVLEAESGAWCNSSTALGVVNTPMSAVPVRLRVPPFTAPAGRSPFCLGSADERPKPLDPRSPKIRNGDGTGIGVHPRMATGSYCTTLSGRPCQISGAPVSASRTPSNLGGLPESA